VKAHGVILIGIFFLFSCFSCAKKGGNVNFSGEWTLNRDNSDFGGGGEFDQGRGEGRGGDRPGTGRGQGAGVMVVKQDNDKLIIERTSRNRDGEEITRTTELSLDGKKVNFEGFMGNTQTATAEWTGSGKTLTISTSSFFEREGQEFEMTSKEIWSLEDNGSVLVIESTRSTPRGDRTSRMVYDKN
jgi:hypothetical protein